MHCNGVLGANIPALLDTSQCGLVMDGRTCVDTMLDRQLFNGTMDVVK